MTNVFPSRLQSELESDSSAVTVIEASSLNLEMDKKTNMSQKTMFLRDYLEFYWEHGSFHKTMY